MYHCLSVWSSIFMILSSSVISLNRHQCAVSDYVLHGVYNLSCRNVYSRISDILHRSFSSLYCFQSVLSSYPHTFLFFYMFGCNRFYWLHPIFYLRLCLCKRLSQSLCSVCLYLCTAVVVPYIFHA